MALRSKVKKHDKLHHPRQHHQHHGQHRRQKKKSRQVLQKRSTALISSKLRAAMAVTSEKQRRVWVQNEGTRKAAVEHTGAELDQFINRIRESQGTCSAKVLALFSKLQELTAHVKAISEQLVAHQSVLTTSTKDLEATDNAIGDAEQTHKSAVANCEQARQEAAMQYVTYSNELEELALIANPEVRASIANYGAHALAISGGEVNASYGPGADGAEVGDYAAAAAPEEEEVLLQMKPFPAKRRMVRTAAAQAARARGAGSAGLAARPRRRGGSFVTKKKGRSAAAAHTRAATAAAAARAMKTQRRGGRSAAAVAARKIVAAAARRATMMILHSGNDPSAMMTQQRRASRPPVAAMVGQRRGENVDGRALGGRAWTSRQCIAFLRFQTHRHRGNSAGRVAAPNETAAAPEEEVGNNDEACTTQLNSLQVEFEQAYHDLSEMKQLKMAEKDSKDCDRLAGTELDAEMVPLTTQREHASDKIEESDAAVNAIRPVLSSLQLQLSQLKTRVTQEKRECTDARELESHLNSVADLIAATIDCPGIGDVSLPTPTDVCHTNGLTCSWSCSAAGQIFATGEIYGQYKTLLNAPVENVLAGRAFCEEHCVKDISCVGFTHHADHGECLLKLDVIDGTFSPAASYNTGSGGAVQFNACFLRERVALVNRFRDTNHPKLDHQDIASFWAEHNKAQDAVEHFHPEGFDEVVAEFLAGLGSTVTKVEPQVASLPVKTEVDGCGCSTGTGWCSQHQACCAGETTSPAEQQCCATGKNPVGSEGAPSCVDSCGCGAAEGWGSQAMCEAGEETSQFEEDCCFLGKAPLLRDGQDVCMDECGCEGNQGWSSFRRQCEVGKTTTAYERAVCTQSGIR